ncbi:hypothetical protein N8J89_39135 [Crossiella sp. CA-258035]|uniref:hypothetical protein n=1 Tax=Crossiella sp. CA-258035 TaxID=2981138 RepID=UPI0024BC4B90|nr:hypothetical protein [Crossiella sp. CA-258035]WHT19042.1 hypothetical protein N8J89_39135 [Crossiella sp. CA-258035]
MTQPDEPAPVLHGEPGSSWWPVLWGPGFAAVALLVELITGGRVNWVPWLLIGGGFGVAALVWVQARRRVCSVALTPYHLRCGREQLPVERIAEVGEAVGAPVGARVLGGGWSVPKGCDELPVRLTDDSVVLAWARDAEGLRDALRRRLDARS